MTAIEHHASIEQVVATVQQRWGVKALRRLEQVTASAEGIPTGYADLDRLLGCGGVPRGAVTCLSGNPTSGKTTLALDVLARVQADGEVTVYVDLTGALDPEYAESRGIDLDQLLIVVPQPPELGLDITRDIITSGGAGLIVLDAGHSGAQTGPAESLSRSTRHLSAAVRRSPYAVLGLTMPAPTRLSRALSARSDVVLRAERARWVWNTEGVSGYDTRLTVVKSRFGPPGPSITVPITLGERRPGP
jgi:recombination protein RecA